MAVGRNLMVSLLIPQALPEAETAATVEDPVRDFPLVAERDR